VEIAVMSLKEEKFLKDALSVNTPVPTLKFLQKIISHLHIWEVLFRSLPPSYHPCILSKNFGKRVNKSFLNLGQFKQGGLKLFGDNI
jgi:hypothetical protein